MPGGMHVWRGVRGRGVCVPHGGVRGRRDGHCSGLYASHLNAFLFLERFIACTQHRSQR